MTTRDALLAAICTHPGEDTPRLAYADWLDEHGDVIPTKCVACKGRGTILIQCDPDQHPWRTDVEMCESCGGSDKEKDPGSGLIPGLDAMLAEFVRVQVELACIRRQVKADRSSPCGCCNRHADNMACDCLNGPEVLRRRERELWVPVREMIRPHLPATTPTEWCIHAEYIGEIVTDVGKSAIVRRGFVDEIYCPMDEWLKIGPAIVRRFPVRAVRLTDKSPFRYIDQPSLFGWSRERSTYRGNPREAIPPMIYDAITLTGNVNVYQTGGLALSALSSAAVAWARAEAGLPQLVKA